MSDAGFRRMIDPIRELLRSGEAKHGDDYLDLTDEAYERESVASLLGHLARAEKGELYDPESGLDPLYHVAARAVLLAGRRKARRDKESKLGRP